MIPAPRGHAAVGRLLLAKRRKVWMLKRDERFAVQRADAEFEREAERKIADAWKEHRWSKFARDMGYEEFARRGRQELEALRPLTEQRR